MIQREVCNRDDNALGTERIRLRSLDARWIRARPSRYHGRTDHQAARLHAPFHPCPRRREKREEVDAMTDLALITAAVELISSVIALVAVIIEKLPVRKDREP